jgi:hypothetical protein
MTTITPHPVVPFLAVPFPEGTMGLIELRSLQAGQRGAPVDRVFAKVGDWDCILRFLLAGLRRNWDLYVGLSARRDASSGTLANCTTLGVLYVDIDFRATAEPEARRRLAEFPLAPTMLVASGAGLHAYWGLLDPVDVHAQEDIVRTILSQLVVKFGGDPSSAEPARVLRVPGTLNHKYDPPRGVVLEVCEPARRYLLDDLAQYLPAPPEPTESARGRFRMPTEPVRSGGRNLLLFRFARSLKARGTSYKAALAAVQAENAERCDPPHEPAEVERAVASAYAQPDRPLVVSRDGEPPERTDEEAEAARATVVEGFEDVHAVGESAVAAEKDSTRTGETPPGRPRRCGPTLEPLRLISVDELIAARTEETRWVVDRLLFDGGVSVAAGKPKAGKSTLVRSLVVAVATGVAWLDRPVHQGGVVYINFEEKHGEVGRLFDRLAAQGSPIKTYVGKSIQRAVEATRLAVEQLPEPPVLIVIDTLQKLIRIKDLNDYAAVTEALDPILNIAREIGAHVLLVHHTVKGERGDPIEEILGSTAIAGFPDSILVLKRSRGSKRRVLWADGRSGVELEETIIVLNPVTQQVTSGGTRQEADEQDAERDILAYLGKQKGPVTQVLIRKDVEGDTGVIAKALYRLVDEGKISRTGEGKKGDPYLYRRALVVDAGEIADKKLEEYSDKKLTEYPDKKPDSADNKPEAHPDKKPEGSDQQQENSNPFLVCLSA